MISIKEWMEVVNYRITEGGTYHAYGVAYSLSSWNGDQDGYSLEIVFDTATQTVHQVQACDYRHNRAYRLINPDSPKEDLTDYAWDDVKWVDLEADDDWIQKALAIVAGEDYDTRVTIPLEFSDQDLLALMKAAHARDVTFNQFIEIVVKEHIGMDQ